MRRINLILFCMFLLVGCRSDQNAVLTQDTVKNPSQQIEVVVEVTEEVHQPLPTPVMTFSSSPEPEPEVTPVITEEPTVTPEPTATPAPYVVSNNVYTIGWISDPQHYSAKFPELYYSMTLFLRDYREQMNLQYVIHTGDLVNDSNDKDQWKVAEEAQSYIKDIPNGVLAGNHDCKNSDYTLYCKYFGKSKYKDYPWYGESYKDNIGHYDLMTIGNTDYLFVYMSYGLDNKAIKWINSVFKKYPDRIGFLLLHEYFTNDFDLAPIGEKIYKNVVLKNSNIYFVLCGHRYGAYHQADVIDDDQDGIPDRTVHQMMFNYQAAGKVGGEGYLRLLQIDEENKTMHIRTYSPNINDFNRFDDPENRETHYEIDETSEDFIIELPWLK